LQLLRQKYAVKLFLFLKFRAHFDVSRRLRNFGAEAHVVDIELCVHTLWSRVVCLGAMFACSIRGSFLLVASYEATQKRDLPTDVISLVSPNSPPRFDAIRRFPPVTRRTTTTMGIQLNVCTTPDRPPIVVFNALKVRFCWIECSLLVCLACSANVSWRFSTLLLVCACFIGRDRKLHRGRFGVL
jgi:hypothetical protein